MKNTRLILIIQLVALAIPFVVSYLSSARDLEIQRQFLADIERAGDKLASLQPMHAEAVDEYRNGIRLTVDAAIGELNAKNIALDMIQAACLVAIGLSIAALVSLRPPMLGAKSKAVG